MSIRRFGIRAVVVVLAGCAAGCVAGWSRANLADRDGRSGAVLVQHAAEVCRTRRPADDQPDYAFTSDGCSVWPDGAWAACCVEHDIAYWCGGDAPARVRADAGLDACVRAARDRHLGDLMYWGVRVGGIPWQPFPWRWAYGFAGMRGYDPPAKP